MPTQPYRVKQTLDVHPQQMPRRYYQPMADGAPPQDPQPGYNALKMVPDPEPTAQSRWTRTPIAFGQTYNTPDSNSASTLYNDANNQAVRIDANFGSDPVINNRMLRHESIHAALAGTNRDQTAADPDVARAAVPIMKTMRKAGYKGDINTELPAYMAAFSNDKGEWTGGVPVEQRNAYVDAYTKALAKQNPQVATRYQRMLIDSSPGTAASKVDLMPGPPPIGGQ